jgi:hypothetical protein
MGILACDANGTGRLDLVVALPWPGDVTILNAIGGGQFSLGDTFKLPFFAREVRPLGAVFAPSAAFCLSGERLMQALAPGELQQGDLRIFPLTADVTVNADLNSDGQWDLIVLPWRSRDVFVALSGPDGSLTHWSLAGLSPEPLRANPWMPRPAILTEMATSISLSSGMEIPRGGRSGWATARGTLTWRRCARARSALTRWSPRTWIRTAVVTLPWSTKTPMHFRF